MNSNEIHADNIYRRVIHLLWKDQNKCPLCNTPIISELLQVGHLERRGHWLIRWDIHASGLICEVCNNNFDEKKKTKLAEILDKRWGEGTAQKIRRLAWSNFRKTTIFVDEKINELKLML